MLQPNSLKIHDSVDGMSFPWSSSASAPSLPEPPLRYFYVEPCFPGASGGRFPVSSVIQPTAQNRYRRGRLLDGAADVDFDEFVERFCQITCDDWPIDGVQCYVRQNPGLVRHFRITNIDTLVYIINEANYLRVLTSDTITLSAIHPAIEYDPPAGYNGVMVLKYTDLRGGDIVMSEDFDESPAPTGSDSDSSGEQSPSDLVIRAGGRVVTVRKYADMESEYSFRIHRGNPSLLTWSSLGVHPDEYLDLVLECNGHRVVVKDFMSIMNDGVEVVSPDRFLE